MNYHRCSVKNNYTIYYIECTLFLALVRLLKGNLFFIVGRSLISIIIITLLPFFIEMLQYDWL